LVEVGLIRAANKDVARMKIPVALNPFGFTAVQDS